MSNHRSNTYNPGSLHTNEDIAATAENLSRWKPRKGERDDSIISTDIIGGLVSRINALFRVTRAMQLKGLDVSKAKEFLGYEPQYSLEQGIAEYVAYVQKHPFTIN